MTSTVDEASESALRTNWGSKQRAKHSIWGGANAGLIQTIRTGQEEVVNRRDKGRVGIDQATSGRGGMTTDQPFGISLPKGGAVMGYNRTAVFLKREKSCAREELGNGSRGGQGWPCNDQIQLGASPSTPVLVDRQPHGLAKYPM